jgi:outer membrane immunogenic protein
VTYDTRVKAHIATFGLAYKFWGDTAVPMSGGLLKAPAAAPSWSGPYAGLGLGVRSTLTDATVTAARRLNADQLAFCALPVIVGFGGCATSEPLNDTTFRASPYLGWNWQVARWVVGVEGDVGFAEKTTRLGGLFYPNLPLYLFGGEANSFSVKTTWDASARVRAGLLVNPSTLVYATGGAAWLHVESTSICNGLCVGVGAYGPAAITDSTTKRGWTIGGGIEAALWRHWLVRGEYRYADFGTISNTDRRTNAAADPFVVSYDLRVRTHTATLGLAYKFDWGAPVVAKY